MLNRRKSINRLDFGTDAVTDLDPGLIFPLFHHILVGVLVIKYELKELWVKVYDMFLRDKPSHNERRWRRFEV